MLACSSDRARLDAKLSAALGAEISALLSDERVADVMLNSDGQVFVDRVGEAISALSVRTSAAQRATLIKTIAHLAGVVVNAASPILEAELPSGERVQGVLPPATETPALVIRRRPSLRYTLEDYVEAGRMSLEVCTALKCAVVARANVLVVGGTGSGKTTLVNALLAEVATSCPTQRVVIIEDRRELQSSCPNTQQLLAVPGVFTLSQALQSTLRLRPDRIVVGEVRGAEVLTMLKAWNTGHPGGFCTVHANDARSGLLRLEQLAAEGTQGFVPRAEVAAAVEQVVFIARRAQGPRVEQVLRVRGLKDGEFVTEEIAS